MDLFKSLQSLGKNEVDATTPMIERMRWVKWSINGVIGQTEKAFVAKTDTKTSLGTRRTC